MEKYFDLTVIIVSEDFAYRRKVKDCLEENFPSCRICLFADLMTASISIREKNGPTTYIAVLDEPLEELDIYKTFIPYVIDRLIGIKIISLSESEVLNNQALATGCNYSLLKREGDMILLASLVRQALSL